MTSDEKFAAARRQIAEAEAVLLQALASARGVLVSIEAENHELRREALERNMKFYTESEFAHELKVSAATIARQRKAGKLKYTQIGGQVRYTSAHLAQVAQTFEQQAQVRNQRPGARGRLRSVS